MLTLKFVGDSNKTVVSCEACDIIEHSEAAVVIVRNKFGQGDIGVEFRLSAERQDFSTLFIENAHGKLVERIGPYMRAPEAKVV